MEATSEMDPFGEHTDASTVAWSALANRRMLSLASWSALAFSVAAYAIVGLTAHAPFHVGFRSLNDFDLRVYHGAAQRLVRGQDIYRSPIWRGFDFTYPPFAALVFLPLAAARFGVDRVAVTAINLALLVWTLRRALLIPAASAGEPPWPVTAWSIAALTSTGAIWLEPTSVTLGYGQVNLLIAALVVFDLSLPDHRCGKGIAIGVAAAIKLTPLLFVVYLLLTHRRRAAARAAAVFAGSIALAYAVLPRDAVSYWSHGRFLSSSHIGNAADFANQSLRGSLVRLSHAGQLSASGYLVIGVVVLAGLALAVSATRRGDEAAGYSLAALTTLLASPISWTHHWTLVVPALLLLARRAHDCRSPWLWAATGALGCVGGAYAPERLAQAHLTSHPGPLTVLTTDPYVLAAMLTLAVTAVVSARQILAPATSTTDQPGVDRNRPASRLGAGSFDGRPQKPNWSAIPAAVAPASRTPSMAIVRGPSRAAVAASLAEQPEALHQDNPVGRQSGQVLSDQVKSLALKPRKRAVHLSGIAQYPPLVHAHPVKAAKQRGVACAQLRGVRRDRRSVL